MADSHPRLRIGAAQVAEVYLDREATVEKDCEYVAEAGELGLDLLVFPEFHVPASPHWYRFDDDRDFETFYADLFDAAVTVPGPAVDRLCEAAAAAETAVVMGVNEKEAGTAGTLYNTQVFIDSDGSLLGARRKLVPTKHERLFHTGGTGADVTTFDAGFGTLGGLMCGEHTNHLAGYAILAQGEAVHAAAWPAFPWREREVRERRIGIRTRFHAFAGSVPTVMATGAMTDELAAAIGQPDWTSDAGTSAIVSPAGEYVAGPAWTGEGIVHAEVDLADRVRSKATHDVTGHYNRFDVFDLRLDRRERPALRFVDEEEGPNDGSDTPE